MSSSITPRGVLSLYRHTLAPQLRAPSRRQGRLQQACVSAPSSTARLFSTTRRNGASSPRPYSDKKGPSNDQSSDQVELPKVSFGDLGANRTVKLVVIAVLMVFGTMESIFWIKVLWAKFGPAPADEAGENDVGSKTV